MSATKTLERRYKKCPAKGFVYVWEGPVRITHWVNVFCIAILIGTGLYINNPNMISSHPNADPYFMGHMRYAHYLTGVIFAGSILIRTWWLFVGNKYSNITSLYNPFKKEDRVYIIQYMKYYMFLEKKPKHVLTHNPMAQYAYIFIFAVFLFQIVSGLALWAQYDPNGTLYSIFGSFLHSFGAQWIRFYHHLMVYIIGVFFIAHIYAAVLVDFRTHAGDVSSIFSGWKADVE